jgi:enoyl-CoA hydratase/carnithine racemase
MAELPSLEAAVEVAAGLHRAQSADGRIERWELHNPARRNAVTPAALRWIESRCAELDGQAVILSSSEGPFCSGFDLTELAAALSADVDTLPDRVLIDATAAMRKASALFIAAVRGYAIGAGVELLACCDLRIMSEGSFVEVPAARLGVVYHAAGIQRFRAVFGGQVTTRLLALAERVGAEALASAGALSHVVPIEEVDTWAHQSAAKLARLDANAIRHNLRFLRATDDGKLDKALLEAHETARVEAYERVSRASRSAQSKKS